MRIRLLAATVAVLALAGCGVATTPKAAPSTQATTAPNSSAISSAAAALPSAARDAIFDQYVTNQGLTAHGGTTVLEAQAHVICAAYAKGQGFVDVIQALVQSGWSAYQAGQMNGAAVTTYCPQYQGEAP